MPRHQFLLLGFFCCWIGRHGLGGESQHSIRWLAVGQGYDSDRRLPNLRASCEAAACTALERVASELGLVPGRLPIRWVFDLALARPQAAGQPFEAGRTSWAENDAALEVILPARKYLGAPQRAASVVLHEATHAVLASAMGSRAAYEAVPRWWREGLALLIAGDGEVGLREAIAHGVHRGEAADAFTRGLTSPNASYPEAYVAVAALRERWGREGLQAFLKDLVAGASFEPLLERYSGLKMEALAVLAAVELRKRVLLLVSPAQVSAFAALLEARANGRPGPLRLWLEKLTVEESAGVLVPTARYLVARDLLATDKGREAAELARNHLLRLLQEPGDAWRPEALVLLGQAEQTLQRQEDACRAWSEVLEVFGEDAAAGEQARRKLAGRR